jgi:hypothetical protein
MQIGGSVFVIKQVVKSLYPLPPFYILILINYCPVIYNILKGIPKFSSPLRGRLEGVSLDYFRNTF